MEKIDIHCHTTRRPLPDTACPDASLDAIAARMREHEIVHTLVYASYFPHRGSGISNFRLRHWIEERRTKELLEHTYNEGGRNEFGLVGSLDVGTYFKQGMSEFEELAEMRALHGIKLYTGYQEVDLAGPKVDAIAQLARDSRVPVLLHTGYSYSAMRSTGNPAYTTLVTPMTVAKLAARHPENEFVLCHLGKPFFDETIAALRETRNVWTDTSGLLDSKYETDEISRCIAELRRVVEHAGVERVLFGSDFPVETHAHAIKIVDAALSGFSEEERQRVYYRNAMRLFGGRT